MQNPSTEISYHFHIIWTYADLIDTNLGVEMQGDQSGEPKRRQTISSCDEGEEVFKGEVCLTI